MKNIDLRRFKRKHIGYDNEVAETARVCVKTIRNKIKDGLKTLNDKAPFLIDYEDFVNYELAKREARKIKLGKYEFYCLKCKTNVKSIDNIPKLLKKKQKASTQRASIHIRSKCVHCNTEVNRPFMLGG